MSERIEAALRMLLDSGDITPMGARIVRQVAEAEVERLTALLKAADDVVALQDRRIVWRYRRNDCPTATVLRGEPDA